MLSPHSFSPRTPPRRGFRRGRPAGWLACLLAGFCVLQAEDSPAATGQAAAAPAVTYRPVDIRTLPEGTEVVDVFLLLGQSNMKGRGVVPAGEVDDPQIVMMHLKGNQWYCARDPLHLDGEKDPLGGSANAGVGPGLEFARRMAARYPHHRIALVPGAVGGSALARWAKGQPLYAAAMKRARLALADGPAGRIRLRGILWIQGERDARELGRVQVYAEKLDAMIRAMREELGQPELPFIAATAGPVVDSAEMKATFPYRAEINAILLDLPNRVPFARCVDTRDLTGHIGDGLHYDTPSQQVIGQRMAAAFLELTEGAAAAKSH